MIESTHRLRNVLVIGAGHMGAIHARQIQASPFLKLVAVVDPKQDRGSELANSVGTRWACCPEAVVDTAEAAIVAVPTTRHSEVARHLLNAGLHLLVEKPLTDTLEESLLITNQAESLHRVLHVGHVEWFNPVIREATKRVCKPVRFYSRREGFLRQSTADVDVVWDLMLHDLHILLSLLGSELPTRIEAKGERVVSDTCDWAEVHLEFSSGCLATLIAHRASNHRLRQIRIEQENENLVLDLLSNSLSIDSRHDGTKAPIPIPARDAIRAEHAAFAQAISGEPHDGVTARSVLPTLELATKISSLLSVERRP